MESIKKLLIYISKWIGFLIIILLSLLLTSYIFEKDPSVIFLEINQEKLLNWDYIEKFELNQEFHENIFRIILFVIFLTYSIKVITAIVRLLKNKKTIWTFKYSTRIIIIFISLYAGIIIGPNSKISSEIYNQKKEIAETIEIQAYEYFKKPNEYLHEKDWKYNTNPQRISRETDTFTKYIDKYDLSSTVNSSGIHHIGSFYKEDEENYFCESKNVRPDDGTRYGIYNSDLINHSLKILIPQDTVFIFDGNRFGWTRPIVKGSKGEKYSSPYDYYLTAGPPGSDGRMDEEAANRKGNIKFNNNTVFFDERSYTIQTGCWNSFTCPLASIGKDQNLEMECKKIETKDTFINEVKLAIENEKN